MSELCKKCSKFQQAESKYDDSGCTLIYPMQDCPKMINILKLPDMWRESQWHQGMNGGKRCATELDEEIRREC